MLVRIIVAICFIFGMTTISLAAGPKKVAAYDRNLWPQNIVNVEAYNRSSKYENLMFASVINTLPTPVNERFLLEFTGLKSVNSSSVNDWLAQTKLRVAQNLKFAQCGDRCSVNNWQHITDNIGAEFAVLPTEYQAWRVAAEEFYSTYLYEQIRLAALFPRYTSEIHKLDSAEHTGFEWKDGEFLLTFDDGPTKVGHHTDQLIDWLNQHKVSALFFAVGERIESRQKGEGVKELASLYKGQCLASHGYRHVSHAKMKNWTNSIDTTRSLVQAIQPDNKTVPFRPPFGQRSLEVTQYLNQKNESLMLWNIDSQDWNRKLNADQVAHRMESLMLLWRRGTLLFHDIHPKALKSMDRLQGLMAANNKQWLSCASAL